MEDNQNINVPDVILRSEWVTLLSIHAMVHPEFRVGERVSVSEVWKIMPIGAKNLVVDCCPEHGIMACCVMGSWTARAVPSFIGVHS